MFFEVSPVHKKPKPKKVEKQDESEEIEVLSLGPFAAQPKIFFENIKVGVTANRKLLIKNPTPSDIHINLRSNIPDDIEVTFSWWEQVIPKNNEVLLEITWTPQSQCGLRFSFILEDNKRLKVEIPVVFKSVSPNVGVKPKPKLKSTVSLRKAKSPVKKVISTRRVSPVKKRKPPTSIRNINVTPPPRASTSVNMPNFVSTSPEGRRTTFCIKDKENLENRVPFRLHDDQQSFKLSPASLVERRQTYTVKTVLPQTIESKEVFNDSLEMASPTHSPEIYKVGNRRVLSPLIQKSFNNRENIDDSFAYKLESVSFRFSPNTTPAKRHNESFPNTPFLSTFSTNLKNVAASETITFEFETSKHNISAETYVKGNLSSETYLKGNTSCETYVKGNFSGGTYVKDNSIGDLSALPPSPINQNIFEERSPGFRNQHLSDLTTTRQDSLSGNVVRNVIEANLWKKPKPLTSISEETTNQSSFSLNGDDSPSRRPIKRKNDYTINVTPLKRLQLDKAKCQPRPSLGWSRTSGNTDALRIAKSVSNLSLNKFKNSENQLTTSISTSHSKVSIVTNPFLYAAVNMVDPFMTSQVYYDEQWIEKQENEFKKWFNALLTPPAELSTKPDEKVDVAKVWQEVKNRDVAVAPTKEVLSNTYHNSNKLNSLRKSAQNLFRSQDMSTVLTKVVHAVDAGKLSIREDKEIHLNITLKGELMSLLLSYNTLWLRIGLETIYNEIIPLSSNSDITGLSTFLMFRMFKDPYLLKKHKSAHIAKYSADFKKFFLKKFLTLVYFLDQAKNAKLIAHDPCLFRKNAQVKESRELLICMAKETLSAVGDINKFLKYFGYVVTHKQTYINEFNYAVSNLGSDLRDGIRLTKIMEIILLKDGLTAELRVPAISRLQKVHNMKIVFTSLEEAGFQILYDITPKDIVDGHKEKTLSFLWQIIYKFEAPLMVKSCTTIQNWFRSLPVVLRRRKLERLRQEKIQAATKIQQWYRRQILSEKLYFFACLLKHYLDDLKRERAAVKIQSFYRMHLERRSFKMLRSMIIKMQAYSKGWLIRNCYKYRIKAAIKIQSTVRMFIAKRRYEKLKLATIVIQRRFRAQQSMKLQKLQYNNLKKAVLFVQTKFRANRECTLERNKYTNLKKAVINIQTRYRATLQMRIKRAEYLELKSAAVTISSWYKSILNMREIRNNYTQLKKTVLFIETKYLAKIEMRKQQTIFTEMKHATIVLQRRYRAQLKMRYERHHFICLKKSALVIQERYRAILLCRQHSQQYNQLRSATLFIQRVYRANRAMRFERNKFIELKNAAIKIQMWYRSVRQMRIDCSYYKRLKSAVRIVEERYLAQKQMKLERNQFILLKKSVLLVQAKYRANIQMKTERCKFLILKQSAILIQKNFRMRRDQQRFRNLRKAVILIQRRFRANRLMKSELRNFETLKKSCLVIQQRYRAFALMKLARTRYLAVRNSAIIVQKNFKCKVARTEFLRLKHFTVIIQRRYRANRMMKLHRNNYLALQRSAIIIQRRFRALKTMRIQRQNYLTIRSAVILIQWKVRATFTMRKQRREFLEMREAAVKIQRFYYGYRAMKVESLTFQLKRRAAVTIQSYVRRYIAMKKYGPYLTPQAREERIQTSAAVKIQAAWRGYKSRRNDTRPEVAKIRQRAKEANAEAIANPQKTLTYKCDQAVQILILDHPSLLHLIKALEDLSYITRRCRKTCIKLSQLVPDHMYLLISCTARSLPEMNVCTLATAILINLCKLPETKKTSFNESYMENIITVMINWSDKEAPLFPHLCTLLWLFAQDKNWKRIIINVPHFQTKLTKLKNLTYRKQKMVAKTGVKGSSYFAPYAKLPLPSQELDWGLEYKNNPYVFTNSVHALNSLLNILES